MAVIGELAVNIVAKTSGLTKGLASARKQVGGMSKTFSSATAGIRKFLGVAAGIGGGLSILGFVAQLRQSAQEIDKLAKTATKLGIATEELAGLQLAAQRTGVDVNTLNTALQRMARRVGEAAKGTGEAQKALRELGLDAKVLAKQAPDEIFRKIARAMSLQTTQTNKLALASKIFDSEGVALLNTLDLGAKGLEKYRREAEALGLAVSKEEAAKIEKFNDALDKLSASTGKLGRTILIKIAPGTTKWLNSIAQLIAPERYKNLQVENRTLLSQRKSFLDEPAIDWAKDPFRTGRRIEDARAKEGKRIQPSERMTPKQVQDLFNPGPPEGKTGAGLSPSKKLIEYQKVTKEEAEKQTKLLEHLDKVIEDQAAFDLARRGGWPLPADTERVTIP